MAKITVSRIFELSKYLATKSGQELKEALTYISEFAEVSLRTLRNGLTFSDNFDCVIKTVSLRTGTESKILVPGRKRAVGVLLLKVEDNTYAYYDTFGWKYDADGNLVVKATFTGSPASTLDIACSLLILFG